MRELKISEMIRELRTDKGISQETLADVCDVRMQAVSKWENGQSCPDITFLPLLAEYFGVSTDYLLTGRKHAAGNADDTILSGMSQQELKDDVLYIVQYRNGKILDKKLWNTEPPENKDTAIAIRFDHEALQTDNTLQIEVWGNANIEAPDMDMNLSAGGHVNCSGTIQGNVSAGAGVNCGTIEGDVAAGASVNCDVVEGAVSAGNSVNCDTVEGNVSAGYSVSCNTIEGDASAGTISCETIEGSAKASSHIEYKNS